jgi:hypothetical protein
VEIFARMERLPAGKTIRNRSIPETPHPARRARLFFKDRLEIKSHALALTVL